MGTTIFDISMSLDGFITASNQTPQEPLGEGGEQHLHGWGFGTDETNRRLVERAVDGLGVYVCGRRTYDHSLPWWGADGASGLGALSPARRSRRHTEDTSGGDRAGPVPPLPGDGTLPPLGTALLRRGIPGGSTAQPGVP